MRARGFGIPAAAVYVILLSFAFAASANHSLCAQQPGTTAASSPSPALPAGVQAKLDKLQADLIAAQAAKDAKAEAKVLNRIGDLYFGVSVYPQALDNYNQALLQARAAKDVEQEAAALNGIGGCYRSQSQNDKALEMYRQALDLATASGDLRGQATALNGIGWVDDSTGQLQEALEFHTRALPLAQKVKDETLEAAILRRIGVVYWGLGEPQKALDYFHQALQVFHQAGDLYGESRTLNNIGVIYDVLGEKQKALDFYNQALQVFRQVGDLDGETTTLNNMGVLYYDLGEKRKALDIYNQALPIRHQLGDRYGEASTLLNIGAVYRDLGESQRALDYFNQALPIYRQIGDRGNEGETLNNIGDVYFDLGEKEKALDFYNQTLPVFRQIGDRSSEAETLNNIGNAYRGLGERQKELDYYSQALPLATAVGNPLLEADIFYSLMLNQKSQQPSLAIFYGKQAVNLLQQVRGNIQGLDKDLQKTFLTSKGDYYRDLADLLIDQGRLPEAQQALDLLKQQEYSDYVRGEEANPASPLSLTPAEQQAVEDYQKSTAQLVSLGEQWSDLKKIAERTPEQEQQYQQLSEQLNIASKGLNDYYARLYTLFGSSGGANKQVADVKGEVSLLKQTIAKMPRTVALYTVVSLDRYSVIVVTGTTAVARETAIPEKDLNQKIAAFQQALRNSHSDPKPPAEELYKILLGPVKADLDQAQAQNLVFSLDGALRYLPMAALYDGKQYVVENYNTVTITPASITHLSEMPDLSNLSAAVMGISRQYEESLPALPAVVEELDDVVNDARVKGADGVLPGTLLLNGDFTEKAMENLLGSPHTVVHIASHFVFRPGDDSQSYLLLAGKEAESSGYHLTVGDFRDDQQLPLDGADLLTLSACETGMSGSAGNGREVDGLATTAQLKGAKAVISSLWEVNDASTGALMADFYKRWSAGEGKVSKVEALRQAQLDLLQGRITPQSSTNGRGFSTQEVEPGKKAGSADYAHPYYWAPFVLMGNWR